MPHKQLNLDAFKKVSLVPCKAFFLHGFLLSCLLCLLAACSTGPSATQPPAVTSTSQPTVTTLPAGTVLYQADWSHGLSNWQGTSGWQVAQGQLETDTSGSNMLIIPYKPIVSNYVIEIRLQLVSILHRNGGHYTIFAQKQSGKDGYKVGVGDLKTPPEPVGSHPEAQAFIDPIDNMDPSSHTVGDYEPGNRWHDYRIEVQNNTVKLLDNGVPIGRAVSDATSVLSNGPLGLDSALVVLRVSSLRILAL